MIIEDSKEKINPVVDFGDARRNWAGPIAKIHYRVKRLLAAVERREVYTAIIIILVGLASFGLGRLSNELDNRPAVKIYNEELSGQPSASLVETQTAAVANTASSEESTLSAGVVVASKNGTKYYFPWCGGVSRISAANKITFASRAEAEKAGYGPAANCKGL